MESKPNEELFSDPLLFQVDVRLSFLQTYAHDLVPDPSLGIDPERREQLKREKAEMDIRIDELNKLKEQMRQN